MNMQEVKTGNKYVNLFAVGDQDFAEQVLASTLPVIVDFWADWCPPCHALAPTYERLSEEYAGKLRFAKMNGEEHPLTHARYGVMGFPTLLIFHNGKEIGRLVGPHPARLQRAIERILVENAAL